MGMLTYWTGCVTQARRMQPEAIEISQARQGFAFGLIHPIYIAAQCLSLSQKAFLMVEKGS